MSEPYVNLIALFPILFIYLFLLVWKKFQLVLQLLVQVTIQSLSLSSVVKVQNSQFCHNFILFDSWILKMFVKCSIAPTNPFNCFFNLKKLLFCGERLLILIIKPVKMISLILCVSQCKSSEIWKFIKFANNLLSSWFYCPLYGHCL